MKAAYILALATSIGAAAADPMVFLIRHGEKPADDNQVGLSAAGQQRAQCLRTVFGRASNYNIGYIMAQAYKSGKKLTFRTAHERDSADNGHHTVMRSLC